jgi:hypothetical protein
MQNFFHVLAEFLGSSGNFGIRSGIRDVKTSTIIETY